MRIVLDTNVLIAAFIAHGTCNEVFEHVIRYHTLVTSDFIWQEFREKLSDKFKFDKEEVEEAVRLLMSRMKIINPILLKTPICKDADDDNILAAGISGNCDCIITGDKELLELNKFGDIDLLKPSNFWKYEAAKHE